MPSFLHLSLQYIFMSHYVCLCPCRWAMGESCNHKKLRDSFVPLYIDLQNTGFDQPKQPLHISQSKIHWSVDICSSTGKTVRVIKSRRYQTFPAHQIWRLHRNKLLGFQSDQQHILLRRCQDCYLKTLSSAIFQPLQINLWHASKVYFFPPFPLLISPKNEGRLLFTNQLVLYYHR